MLTPTRTLATPTGEHSFELRNYVTGRQKRLYRSAVLSIAGENKGNTPEGYDRLENAIVELMVASLDGSAESILDRLLDMKSVDFDFLMEQANEAFVGLSPKDGGTSSASTKTGSEDTK